MDNQPLPSAQTGFGRDRDQDRGERRAFTQPSWENARAGGSSGGGMGGGMGGRGTSYDGENDARG